MKSERQHALDAKILRQAMSGPHRGKPSTVVSWILVLVGAVLVALTSGCAKKTQLQTLDTTAKAVKAGRVLISEKCDNAKQACIDAMDEKCQKLTDCHAAEKKVYAAVATVHELAELAAAYIRSGGALTDKGLALMGQVLKRYAEIKKVLEAWGVSI